MKIEQKLTKDLAVSQVQEVPYIDFAREYRFLKKDLDKAYEKLMENGLFILGPEVESFEKDFAKYCRVKHGIGLGSGIDALTLVLKAWDIGPGDEVIVAGNTYIASAFAVTHVGAKPVFVDASEDTFNIDENLIEQAINPQTKAIMPTHLYGQMSDMQKIMELANKYRLKVLEDASQAHGAKQAGKICGGHGDAVAFSLYPTKNLGAYGDGGIVVTNDEILKERLLYLRNNGSKSKFYYDYIGYNSRLDEMQAAFLRVKLRHLDFFNKIRNELAEVYQRNLTNIPGLILPSTVKNNLHVWHVYCVRVMNDKREELMSYLSKNNIGFNIHYPMPPHLQNCYLDLGYKQGDFPKSEKLSEEILSLPLTPFHLQVEVEFVCQKIKEFFEVK